ncbi:unnamed protein product [Auanema sp. JU1783]|nr:unnamed protein product [Auanema sp. JU1783]
MIIYLLILNSFFIINSVESLHHKLTKREIQHVFGVEEKHQIPTYHMIKPEKYETEDGHLRMKFDAFDNTYEMQLKPNTRIISPHLISVIRNGTDAKEFKGLPLKADCHYQGNLLSHSNERVAISDCNQLMGTLHMDDHFLIIQTVPHRVQHHQEERHLVFKRSAGLLTDLERHFEEEIVRLNEEQEPFCDTSESLDDPLGPQILSLNYSIPSSAQLDSPFIFPNMDAITLEIGLFLDSKLFEHFQREYIQDPEQHLMDFSLALINNVHVLYQQPTLSPNIDIIIVRYEMWKSQPSNLDTLVHKGGQAQALLDAFCRHQSHINPGTDLTDMGHWDHGVLLTGYDIYHTTSSVAGVAPVARMCDPLFACSLVEGLHLGRSFVLAHEMGHNMGMVHDGVQNQCSRSCCLMSAVNGAGKTTWSECSVREFNAFLLQLDESGRGNCLRDSSPGLISHNHLNDVRLPGQRFTADQQCSYFWGRDYQVEIPAGRSMEDICRILWCGNSGSTISTAHPALEGSWCGDNKWCHEGRCASWPNGEQPLVVHGQWSDWSNGEKLCPVQQCHIQGSITIKAQHRDCVNPAPNNGGRTCKGSSIRGSICGSHISHCDHGLSREEFSNRVCAAIKNDPFKPDLQLTGEGFDHSTQPCRVWCHLVDSELIRNKGQFPDGAPCGDNQFCVSGVCLNVGCSNKALIEMDEDCPAFQGKKLGKWNDWTKWSDCSVSCGDGGHQQRKRSCVGRKCKGVSEELRNCNPPPPECSSFSDWGEWTACNVNCGSGTQRRKRICLYGDCDTDLLEERKTCDKPSCWNEWSDWSICSQSCDGGEQQRERTCSDIKDDCAGDRIEVSECNTEPCKSHDEESSWGDWLPCSVSCGIGFQIRERLCGGVLCTTANKQARTCNEQSCPKSTEIKWDDWGVWTECSATCGEGIQTRHRACLRGDCPPEESKRERRCVNKPCPEVTWNEWSDWTNCLSCSSTEIHERTRTCSNGHTGKRCFGSPIEVETCDRWCAAVNHSNGKRRAIEILTAQGKRKVFYSIISIITINVEVVAHGERIVPINEKEEEAPDSDWSHWNEWTSCSASCGGGTRRRTRVCMGVKCPLQPLQVDRQSCNTDSCDLLGNHWSPWTDWSDCSVSCGVSGLQTRRRRCTAFFIFQCSGASLDTRNCPNLKPCQSEISQEVQYPNWSPWSSWSSCSCFTSTETRRRFCRIADPSVQGFCSGPILEQRPCVASNCLSSPGGWSLWSEWSVCSKDCQGTGHQIRNRMCSEPIPANKGPYCNGYSFDQRSCSSNEQCGTAIDGGWTEWTDWSECSDYCTNGHKSRTRFCSNPRPSQGGQPCFGSDFELQPCSDASKCPHSHRDGSWSLWSSWSDCPANCGFALQSRYRSCDFPPPSGAGLSCRGLAVQSSICNLNFCPESRDGEWSAWNEWSSCISNCGSGSRTRIRGCLSPSPSDGGSPCFGRSSEVEECYDTNDDSFCSRFVQNSQVVDSQVSSVIL